MLSRLLALALTAAASQAAAAGKLALKPFDIGDLSGDRAERMLAEVAKGLQESRVAVLAPTPEQEKALDACAKGVACAAKLGATGVLFGTVRRASGGFQLTLDVTDETGATIATRTGRTLTEEQLVELAALYGRQLGEELAPRWAEPTGAARKLAWLPGALGLVGAAIGAGLFAQSRSTAAILTDGQRHTLVDAMRARDSASLQQTIGVVAMGAGAALVLVAILLWAVG